MLLWFSSERTISKTGQNGNMYWNIFQMALKNLENQSKLYFVFLFAGNVTKTPCSFFIAASTWSYELYSNPAMIDA